MLGFCYGLGFKNLDMPEDKEDSYELGRKKHKLWLETNIKRFEEEAGKANRMLVWKTIPLGILLKILSR